MKKSTKNIVFFVASTAGNTGFPKVVKVVKPHESREALKVVKVAVKVNREE